MLDGLVDSCQILLAKNHDLLPNIQRLTALLSFDSETILQRTFYIADTFIALAS